MKRYVCMALGVCMCAGLLTGCGADLEGDTSVVYVGKNGTITSLDVEQFDESYYNAEELTEFIDAEVSDYTQENGGSSVKMEELTIEAGTARLQMKYKTADDYSSFNGIELYQGKVIDALAAGYIFDGDFARVEEGEVVGAASKQDIYQEQDLKVVVIRANTDVRVEGEICYVSCENVALTGTDSVSIRDEYYLDNGAAEFVAESTEQIEEATEIEDIEMADIPVEIEEEPIETEVYTFIVYK